jgi:hypothetical protein
VVGRAGEEGERHVTTTRLNIRTGPGAQHEMMPGAPLPGRVREKSGNSPESRTVLLTRGYLGRYS